MIPFILKYWSQLLSALGAGALSIVLTYTGLSWYYDHKLTAQATQLEGEKQTAITNERNTCATNQAITQETTDELQRNLTDTNDRLAAYKHGLLNSKTLGACVPITNAASGHDAPASGGLPAVQGGVVAESLTDAAATADRQAAQLKSCQAFITKTWAEHQYRAPALKK